MTSSHQAELIIATNFNLPDAPVAFRPIQKFDQYFLQGLRPVFAWVFDFDENWADVQLWVKALACIGNTVNKFEVTVE